MKKLLLLLSLLPALCSAQNLTISAGGGMALAGLYHGDMLAEPSAMLSATIERKSLYMGLRADIFKVRATTMFTDVIGIPRAEKTAYFNPAVSLSAAAGKVFHHRLLDVRIGVNAGVIFGAAKSFWFNENTSPGFTAGLDATVTHYFHKHLGLFANFAPRYIVHSMDAIAFPLNAGLSLKI